MTTSRTLGWAVAVAVAALVGATPARALTTVETPVTSNGARFASPDPDQQLEQRFNGQDGDSQRGFSIQVRPQTPANDANSPFGRQRPMLPWLPGEWIPPR